MQRFWRKVLQSEYKFGRLAQLVQSICLTSRGSAVRIRQRPHFFILVTFRAFSSAGSEHLPYKQRVGGSNPSTPTNLDRTFICSIFFLLNMVAYNLYSEKADIYYIGLTGHITDKLERHNVGRCTYAKWRTPWKVDSQKENSNYISTITQA